MNKTIGILAHVDGGKTTLCEEILYNTNSIRKKGRVDHKDSYFDNNKIERQRGITVFSKEGYFNYKDSKYYLIDTPGHIDFSPEMERSLKMLDYAILIISGVEKVQSHSETIFNLLKEYKIPTIIFVNKMDREIVKKHEVEINIRENLSENIFDFTEELNNNMSDELIEFIAEKDEKLLEMFLEDKYDYNLWLGKIKDLFLNAEIYPCVFGSALYNENVDVLLEILEKLSETNYKVNEDFLAKVYKIKTEDNRNKMTFVKILSGKVKLKEEVCYKVNDKIINEKINEIRIYNGEKLIKRDEAYAGEIVAIKGLSEISISSYIIKDCDMNKLSSLEKHEKNSNIVPTLSTKIIFEEDVNMKDAYSYMKILGSEDSSLNPIYNEELKEIQISIMGKIQLEILKEVILERFNLKVDFGPCEILYKESIKESAIGVGHFEPLKHYAEVVLKIEPNKRNSGITFESLAHVDDLSIGHQNLIKTHIFERKHRGILGGFELTDLKITLLTGRAHIKHTEGGDFREATFRALRQGLEEVENILLEPYYKFKIEIENDYIGRVISDIQKMSGSFEIEDLSNNKSLIYGRGPVSEFMDYPLTLTSFTKGRGKISFIYDGYEKCHNSEEVLINKNYDKDSDKIYTSNSIFCSKGQSYTVKGKDVKNHMHCEINNYLGDKNE